MSNFKSRSDKPSPAGAEKPADQASCFLKNPDQKNHLRQEQKSPRTGLHVELKNPDQKNYLRQEQKSPRIGLHVELKNLDQKIHRRQEQKSLRTGLHVELRLSLEI